MNIANYMNSASTSTTRNGNTFRLPEVNIYDSNRVRQKKTIKDKLRDMAYSPTKSRAHQGHSESSIIDQAKEYSKQLAQTRANQTDTTNQVKQLRYKFKDIASQIRQSKNSISAKKVVLAARREVLRLKRLGATGEYDEDELASAINHAKSMERIAKKKARHLQEEEMVRIAEGKTSEMEGDEKESKELEEADDSSTTEYEDYDDEQLEDLEEIAEYEQGEPDVQSELVAMLIDNQEMMNSDLEQITEDMEELLKDSSLGELLEDASPIVEREMSEEDFKAFKQNHRNKEEKMLIKADAEYLKDTFERYEQMKVDITV